MDKCNVKKRKVSSFSNRHLHRISKETTAVELNDISYSISQNSQNRFTSIIEANSTVLETGITLPREDDLNLALNVNSYDSDFANTMHSNDLLVEKKKNVQIPKFL